MNSKLTSISSAISVAFLMNGLAHADSGAIGSNGSSTSSPPVMVIGGSAEGAAGLSGNQTVAGGGGDAVDVTGKNLTIGSAIGQRLVITGTPGSNGGSFISVIRGVGGSGGAGGHGGGSIFGGISTGGAGGNYNGGLNSPVNGGNGGRVTDNQINLTNVELNGSSAEGGAGGNSVASNIKPVGGAGAAGHGGGSVFGGISTGGAGGMSYVAGTNESEISVGVYANGGNGGDVSSNKIEITNSLLRGSSGGVGGSSIFDDPNINLPPSYTSHLVGGSGVGGNGGGSVFGGISTGGAGGNSEVSSANGGNGGNVFDNRIKLMNVTLDNSGATAGSGGSSPSGNNGAAGYGGGSVFGGISTGGAGGYAAISGFPNTSANGGDGGNVTGNQITISGESLISGSIYGGISQGGATFNNLSTVGKGGLVQNNTVTIIGDNVSIAGSIYGGLSINGNGIPNADADYSHYYAGNTLVIQSGDLQLNGSIKNFQNYTWLIPEYEKNGGKIITVVSGKGTPVDISNTIHSVDVQATGNILNGGDQITLITQVTGEPSLKPIGKSLLSSRSNIYIEQGFFIVYEAEMVTQDNGASGNSLVLNVLDVRNGPDGKIHPESEEFLKGRMAQLAIVDQGADMIGDGISYARASLRKENANVFAIVDGGSNKYKNGGVSTLKLNDFKFALGAAKAWKLENESVGMVAVFAEHGNGKFNSYNYFDYFGDTRASGKVRYNGVGLMAHMDVANTDVSKVKNKPNIFDDKYGLYLDAALRVGHLKVDFHSADMVNGAGVEARYNTKSRYASAMLGTGYVWTLDEKSSMDFYARYTYSRLNGKDVQVVDEQMHAGATHSKRLRFGARYGYAYSSTTTPYAGLAFERNFTGDVTGSAYGFTIKETSLKGNAGILEAGVMVKPKGADDPFSLRLGIQGYFGQRKGATAEIRARYVF